MKKEVYEVPVAEEIVLIADAIMVSLDNPVIEGGEANDNVTDMGTLLSL